MKSFRAFLQNVKGRQFPTHEGGEADGAGGTKVGEGRSWIRKKMLTSISSIEE